MNPDWEGSLGLPVQIGQIDREFARLWEEAGESKVRASLLNLVIYCEEAQTLADNTRILSEIAGRHACRAILIFANRSAPEAAAQAWINAHCQVIGSRQVCSEQITFRLDGPAVEALPSVVFSHLDADLPLCCWWRAPLRAPVEESLWSWVDRLVFDSADWSDPLTQLPLIRQIGALGDGRTILGDLNWARVLGTRFAIAGLFDHACALSHLSSLDRIAISHAPGCRVTALLLLGWFAARVGWNAGDAEISLRRPDGALVPCLLSETTGPSPPISRCSFHSGEWEFRLERVGDSFTGTVGGPDCDDVPRIFAVPRESLPDLLVAELSRGGRHGNYRDALALVSHWLAKQVAA